MMAMSKNWELMSIRKVAKTLNVSYERARGFYEEQRKVSPEHCYGLTITYMHNIQRVGGRK